MRPLFSLVIGAVVAALLAYLATVVIDNTTLPNWLDDVAWIVAVVLWLVWAFPAYFNRVT